jgi:NADPH:quinone reductase-like Zn-dependent oxidoreductase
VRLEERPDPEAGDTELVVAVRYAGLSPADLHQRDGRYGPLPGRAPDIGGMEVAGRVASRGSAVTSFDVGDRVFGFVGGAALAERVLADERTLAPIPDSVSELDAASVPSSFISAHDALYTQARVRPGETVLVHGAAGGFGSAALQLARTRDARAIGVVRSDAAAAAVESLGAESVRDDGFAAATLELTDGRGADVILETVGGVHFPANLEAIAERGRIIVLTSANGGEARVPLTTLLPKRVSIVGTTLRMRPFEEQIRAVRAFADDVVPMLADGRICAVVDSVHPADRPDAAFDRLASSGKVGNVLVEFPS